MSTQKSRTNKSRSKNTIPKTKPYDYLKKYVGNTPENVRRMREIFKTDGEIFRKFPYLTKGDDRDFHVFYEYIENKHLLDEKKIFPFDDTRDYSFLYWFLDEIVPQNWDKLGAGQERERKKFRDGYYLNMSEIIEQADLNKYENMFRQSRGVMPLPPLGKEDKNNASKWRNWKIEYAKWKNQEYRLHPELSRSRDERSAPRELDDYDDVDPLVHNRNILNGTDRLNRENCLSDGKTPTASSDVKNYYEQLDYFRDENNKGCQKDAQFKKVRLHDLFQDQLEREECAEIDKPLVNSPDLCVEYESRKEEYENKQKLYKVKPCGLAARRRLAELESHCETEKTCYVEEPKEIAYDSSNREKAIKELEKILLNYNGTIKRYSEARNEKCEREAMEKKSQFIQMNQMLYREATSNNVSRNRRPAEIYDSSISPLSTLSSGSHRSASSSIPYKEKKLAFDYIYSNFDLNKDKKFFLGEGEYNYLGKPMMTENDNVILFSPEDGGNNYMIEKTSNGAFIKIELNSSGKEIKREEIAPEYSFFVETTQGGKKSLRKTKRNKNKKRQTKRRR